MNSGLVLLIVIAFIGFNIYQNRKEKRTVLAREKEAKEAALSHKQRLRDDAIAAPPSLAQPISQFRAAVSAFDMERPIPALPFDTEEYQKTAGMFKVETRAKILEQADKDIGHYFAAELSAFNAVIASIKTLKSRAAYALISAESVLEGETVAETADVTLPANIVAAANFTYPTHLQAESVSAYYERIGRGLGRGLTQTISRGDVKTALIGTAIVAAGTALTSSKKARQLQEIEGKLSLYYTEATANAGIFRAAVTTQIAMLMEHFIDCFNTVERLNHAVRNRKHAGEDYQQELNALHFTIKKGRLLLALPIG